MDDGNFAYWLPYLIIEQDIVVNCKVCLQFYKLIKAKGFAFRKVDLCIVDAVSDTTMFNCNSNAGYQNCLLFPLNGGRWLAADIINHPINTLYIIDDAIADMC